MLIYLDLETPEVASLFQHRIGRALTKIQLEIEEFEKVKQECMTTLSKIRNDKRKAPLIKRLISPLWPIIDEEDVIKSQIENVGFRFYLLDRDYQILVQMQKACKNIGISIELNEAESRVFADYVSY